jgi:predicted CoA-binding protein
MPLLDSNAGLLQLLRSARTIAVVGISDDPRRDSHRIGSYLKDAGYTIFPVNPNLHAVLGLNAYPDLASIGREIDVVDVFRRPDAVPAVVADAIRAGARSIWLQYGTVNNQAVSAALSAGLDVVVDRCIMIEHRRLCL